MSASCQKGKLGCFLCLIRYPKRHLKGGLWKVQLVAVWTLRSSLLSVPYSVEVLGQKIEGVSVGFRRKVTLTDQAVGVD